MKKIGSANHLGGMHEKDMYVDKHNNEWLHKPSKPGAEWVSHGEWAAGYIGKKINPKKPHVGIMEPEHGPHGTVQQFDKDAAPVSKDFTDFSNKDVESLQREHVFDWLVGNHDSHMGQFIRNKSGDLIGIDKGQAFKHFGEDELSVDYHPNEAYGEQEPVYNTLGKMARDGKVKLDPKVTFDEIIKTQEKFHEWDTSVFDSVFNTYLSGRFPGDESKQKEFVRKFRERLDGLGDDFKNWYKSIGIDVSSKENAPHISPEDLQAGIDEFHEDIENKRSHDIEWAQTEAQIPLMARAVQDKAKKFLSERMATEPDIKVPNIPEVSREGVRLLPDTAHDFLDSYKMDSHTHMSVVGKTIAALHEGDHRSYDDFFGDESVSSAYEKASLSGRFADEFSHARNAPGYGVGADDIAIGDAMIKHLSKDESLPFIESLIYEKEKTKHHLRTVYPELIHRDENGREHITLHRSTDRPTSSLDRDHPLASYAMRPDSVFGDYATEYHVPLGNVWASYLHGSAAENNHEFEFVVSPPKEERSHKINYMRGSGHNQTAVLNLAKNREKYLQSMSDGPAKDKFAKDSEGIDFTKKMDRRQFDTDSGKLLDQLYLHGFNESERDRHYGHDTYGTFHHDQIIPRSRENFAVPPSEQHPMSSYSHEQLKNLKHLPPVESARLLAHMYHHQGSLSPRQLGAVKELVGEEGYEFLNTNIPYKGTGGADRDALSTSLVKQFIESDKDAMMGGASDTEIKKAINGSGSKIKKEVMEAMVSAGVEDSRSYLNFDFSDLHHHDIPDYHPDMPFESVGLATYLSQHKNEKVRQHAAIKLGDYIEDNAGHPADKHALLQDFLNKSPTLTGDQAEFFNHVLSNMDPASLHHISEQELKPHSMSSGNQYRIGDSVSSMPSLMYFARNVENPTPLLRQVVLNKHMGVALQQYDEWMLSRIHPDLPEIVDSVKEKDSLKKSLAPVDLRSGLAAMIDDWESPESRQIRAQIHSLSMSHPHHAPTESAGNLHEELIRIKTQTLLKLEGLPQAKTINGEKCIPLYRFDDSPMGVNTSVERFTDLVSEDVYVEPHYVPISKIAVWYGCLPVLSEKLPTLFVVSPFGLQPCTSSDVKPVEIQGGSVELTT